MNCGPTHHFGCECHEKQWKERLEKAKRERDESRRLFESSKSARKSLSDACDHLQRKLDDARETLSDVRRAIGAGKNEGIRLAAMRVKAERDEALEQAARLREKYRVHHDEAEKLTAEIAKVREQRDALVKECEWMRALIETIRDKADLRFNGNRGLCAFSDLKDAAIAAVKGGVK